MEPWRAVDAHNKGAEARKMLFGPWAGEKIRIQIRIPDLFSESFETVFG
jgi:hypothetical protein